MTAYPRHRLGAVGAHDARTAHRRRTRITRSLTVCPECIAGPEMLHSRPVSPHTDVRLRATFIRIVEPFRRSCQRADAWSSGRHAIWIARRIDAPGLLCPTGRPAARRSLARDVGVPEDGRRAELSLPLVADRVMGSGGAARRPHRTQPLNASGRDGWS